MSSYNVKCKICGSKLFEVLIINGQIVLVCDKCQKQLETDCYVYSEKLDCNLE